MDTRQARPTSGKSCGTAAVVLLLWLISSPAPAATGVDTRCDRSVPALPPEARIPPPALTIDVADLGAPDLADSLPNDVPLQSAVPEAFSLIPAGAVNPSRAGDDVDPLAGGAASDLPAAPPMAGTKSGGEDGQVADSDDHEAADAEPSPGVATKLPGVSDADMLRFREQMYRTDI